MKTFFKAIAIVISMIAVLSVVLTLSAQAPTETPVLRPTPDPAMETLQAQVQTLSTQAAELSANNENLEDLRSQLDTLQQQLDIVKDSVEITQQSTQFEILRWGGMAGLIALAAAIFGVGSVIDLKKKVFSRIDQLRYKWDATMTKLYVPEGQEYEQLRQAFKRQGFDPRAYDPKNRDWIADAKGVVVYPLPSENDLTPLRQLIRLRQESNKPIKDDLGFVLHTFGQRYDSVDVFILDFIYAIPANTLGTCISQTYAVARMLKG